MSRNYYRIFITLKNDKPGYGLNNRFPSGRCVIEARGDSGKVVISVQNLKPNVLYKAYAICYEADKSIGIPMGNVSVDPKGKGELRVTFDANDCFGAKTLVESINTIALIVPGNGSQISPLVGFAEEPVNWRRNFTDFSKQKPDAPSARAPQSKKPPVPEVIPIHKNRSVNESIGINPNSENSPISEADCGCEKAHAGDDLPVEARIEKEIRKPELTLVGEKIFEPEPDASEEKILESKTDLSDKKIFELKVDLNIEKVSEPKTDLSDKKIFEPEADLSDKKIFESEKDLNDKKIFEPETDLSREKIFEPTTDLSNKDFFDSKENLDTAEISATEKLHTADDTSAAERASAFEEAPTSAESPDKEEISGGEEISETISIAAENSATDKDPESHISSQSPNSEIEDFFVDEGKKLHEAFKAMAREFNQGTEELNNLKFFEKENIEILKIHKKQNVADNIDELEILFENNIEMMPFKRQRREVKWIRGSLKELVLLPIDFWLYMKHPFVVSCHEKFRHLIMGIEERNSSKQYYIGVPDIYDDAKIMKASQLGFIQFKCCEDVSPKTGEHGYWLMPVD